MKIQLAKRDFRAIELTWNILSNIKNKDKNYYINPTPEESSKLGQKPQLQINFRIWMLREHTIKSLSEVVEKIYRSVDLKNTVSYETVYENVKKILEDEITSREQNLASKRDFSEILENIEKSINSKLSHFEFFFAIEGLLLEFERPKKINCGNVEIFVFDQEFSDYLTKPCFEEADKQNLDWIKDVQEFLSENFLGHVCVKAITYGDAAIAKKQAYKQVRDLINYFRYILCLFFYEKISEQMIKINLLSEVYSNGEKVLIRRAENDHVSLSQGRGRRPLQTFNINVKKLQDIRVNGFLDDFIEIINASSLTELEGCILTAVYWIGEAQNESDLDIAFLKYWTALECIFSEKEDTTKSLAKGVATIITFSNYDFARIEDTNKIYKDVVSLYKRRSDIIHRGMNYLADKVISEVDVSKICKYAAWSILNLFDLRSIGYTTTDQIKEKNAELYAKLDIQK